MNLDEAIQHAETVAQSCEGSSLACSAEHRDMAGFLRELKERRAAASTPLSDRQNWIGAPQFFNLNQACVLVREAFGATPYLVGSALVRRDHRDVDVRLVVSDKDFETRFPGACSNTTLDAKWSLLCSAISAWLSKQTDLPVDFQIQRQSEANKYSRKEGHGRQALGWFIEPSKPEST